MNNWHERNGEYVVLLYEFTFVALRTLSAVSGNSCLFCQTGILLRSWLDGGLEGGLRNGEAVVMGYWVMGGEGKFS